MDAVTCSLINEMLVNRIHVVEEDIDNLIKRLEIRGISDAITEDFYQSRITIKNNRIVKLNKALEDMKECGCMMTLKP